MGPTVSYNFHHEKGVFVCVVYAHIQHVFVQSVTAAVHTGSDYLCSLVGALFPSAEEFHDVHSGPRTKRATCSWTCACILVRVHLLA